MQSFVVSCSHLNILIMIDDYEITTVDYQGDSQTTTESTPMAQNQRCSHGSHHSHHIYTSKIQNRNPKLET